MHSDTQVLSTPPFVERADLNRIHSEFLSSSEQVRHATACGVSGDSLRLLTVKCDFWGRLYDDARPLNAVECLRGYSDWPLPWWQSDPLMLGHREAASKDLVQLEGLLFSGQLRSAAGPRMLRQCCYLADFVLLAATEANRGIWGFWIGNYQHHDPKKGVHSNLMWVRPEVRRQGVATYLVDATGNPGPLLSARVRSDDEREFWESLLHRDQVVDADPSAF